MQRPKKSEYAPFFETYIRQLPPRLAARTLLTQTMKEARALFGSIPEEKGDHAYAPGKWTVKGLLVHLIDSERVFAYRILTFMRGDRIALPGFHQDLWMEQSNAANRTIKDLLREWKAVRDNTLFLLDQITDEQSVFPGTASNWKTTPRALFYIIAGHQLHHHKVFRELYLPALQGE
ncbi:MAG: DinB family protein [Saprospiraceae bacterium]|nr:DinB family protein [Saprospiraceae bacterium]